ncbi:MAG: biotin--[acetyl-CoA-carboxylase] ligase [Lachnospiraceae bacterium]
MKREILEILRERGDFVSGAELCEKFGVSRTAVWKAVRSLTEEGYQIEAVRNRGYRLIESPDILSEEIVRRELHTRWAGKQLEVYDQIGSTNDRLREVGEAGAPEGTLIVANHQTAGKGRRGRVWQTPAGSALAFSLLLRPAIPPEKVSMLTLAAAVAVRRGIEKASGLSCRIKWPNDVVHSGKKICGILTELSAEMEQVRFCIVGIGINVTVRDFPGELRDKATSILTETGKTVSRSVLLNDILEAFEELYEAVERDQDLSSILPEYEANMAGINEKVIIEDPKRQRQGTCLGITPLGAMKVRYDDGSGEDIISGEVSVRGLYRYI